MAKKVYTPTKDTKDELNAAIDKRYEREPKLLSMQRSITFENEDRATVTFRCRETGWSSFASCEKQRGYWFFKDWND